MSEEESSNNYTCEACGKEIENEEPMIHSGNIYHKIVSNARYVVKHIIIQNI